MKVEFGDMTIELKDSERTWVERLEDFMRVLIADGYVCPRDMDELRDYCLPTFNEDDQE